MTLQAALKSMFRDVDQQFLDLELDDDREGPQRHQQGRHVDRAAEILMPISMCRPAVAVLAVSVSILSLAGCSSSGSAAPSPSSSSVRASSTPSGSTSPTDPSAVGADAEAILTKMFTGREPLGGGYGALQPIIGNTLADTPKGVLTVTFAFVCTGSGTVQLGVGVDAADSSKKSMYQCDKSVNQQSVELATPGPVSFRATVSGGAADGSFAFGYYAEKTQS